MKRYRYAVLFGQSPNNLQEGEGLGSTDKEFRGPGGYFAHRITRLLKTENFNQRLSPFLGITSAQMVIDMCFRITAVVTRCPNKLQHPRSRSQRNHRSIPKHIPPRLQTDNAYRRLRRNS